MAKLRQLADALGDGNAVPGAVASAAGEVIAALRAEGFPLRATAYAALTGAQANDMAEQHLANAVERSLTPLSSQPTSVDLSRALGVGEHHALRRANGLFRRFYFSVAGWREYLRRRRIDLGAFFMGRPDARTEDVAHVLGFRSPTSFCHAFQAASLPSPRAVQDHLLAS
jgi:AraC-like DNA-binding protein